MILIFRTNDTYNSGLGNEMSAISPKGMKASWSVWAVTWLSSPPTKRVAFSRVWSDMVSFYVVSCRVVLIRIYLREMVIDIFTLVLYSRGGTRYLKSKADCMRKAHVPRPDVST
jgi:hypothetical protein